ncbi:MAG: hypothetical protein BGO40_04565 [Chryseobacterium sp. 39-10]|nr:hypothetical protein [Chryseobacterium sp.]OJV46402.1 MAG: hypothetical protein BGO40_04565 [Chryseobacterium sp. 39-10]
MKFLVTICTLLLVTGCDSLPTSYPGYGDVTINESREFAQLMENDQKNKTKETAEVLNYLLNDTDPKDLKTAAVITNNSNCDIIVRLISKENNVSYLLPIARSSKNQFVIRKGNYLMKSNVCNAKYESQKNISEPLMLKLSSH